MAFRLVTLNLNGIRSAASKGFVPWAEAAGADCMGVQEIRAQADTCAPFCTVAGLQGHFHYADKRGYSGVGIYTRRPPSDVVLGFGDAEFDAEGRYIELRFDRGGMKLSIISCYFPSGSSGEHRQAAKYRFLAGLHPHLRRLLADKREFIVVGDVNIAHRDIDLKNWRGNRNRSGCLPEERAWLTQLLEADGLVDVFRRLNPREHQYTWWSNRGQARARNVGWRLDYQLATPGLAALARREHIDTEQKFSDHAPLTIDYDFKF